MLELAWASLRSRALSVGLTVLVITLSVLLLLGVERVRTQAHEGFASTVSGTDLIVGARSGPVNLLLYSVFQKRGPVSSLAIRAGHWSVLSRRKISHQSRDTSPNSPKSSRQAGSQWVPPISSA